MTRRTRRLPLVLALAGTILAVAGPALATDNVTTRRLAGTDRYATAAAIAQDTFPSGSRTAVLASAINFPDALASAYLTGRLRAPVLLTEAGRLTGTTERALSGLSVSGVTIVGGTDVVSENVAARLRELGYEVTRVAGGDRYATARAIAEVFPPEFVGQLGSGGRTAIVASGEGFADALAGAPVSFSESFPVLLTPKAALSPDAAAAFDRLGIRQVLLLGGPAAVSDAVQAEIESKGITVSRLFGPDRTATAARIADFEVDNLGWQVANVNLARGDAFADALAGGPHEGTERAPLLLTVKPDALGAPTRVWLEERADRVASIDVFGGPAAVTDGTIEEARQAATPQPS